MGRNQQVSAAVSALTLSAVLGFAAAPARADVVTDWIKRTGDATTEYAKDGRPNVDTSMINARVALAMFEAANAVERRYQPYLRTPAAPAGADAEAAVATAAHDVLVQVFPKQKAALDETLTASLARIADGPGETAGVQVGQGCARDVLARVNAADGVTAQPYRPATAPGVYVPTNLPVIEPWRITLRPWFMASAAQFRPAGPPALTSARYARDYEEVRSLGSRDSKARTKQQTDYGRFWAGMDTSFALREVASRPGRTLAQNARLYALVSMVGADAGLAVAEAKLHYGYWRPVTAIRNGDRDSNDATPRQADWEPLLPTPLHPEYPCGHCIGSAAWAALVAAEPGVDPDQRFLFENEAVPGLGVALTPAEYARETSMSRIYAGVHYRFSNEDAEKMGRDIAALAISKFAQPLP